LASEKEPISGRQFSRNVAACTLARAAGQSPPTALRRRQARPFTAELAPTRVSPGQGLLSLLGPTIPCRGRTFTCKHVKDRRLHVEWSGGATGLDQWLPVFRPFRASWQMATRSCPRFLRPLYSFRTAGFPQYGWKPALSSRALPKPFGASFDAGAAVHPFLAISYPGVWNGGCAHRPLAQRGLSCPRLQSLLRPDPPV
jgi:hypothetical protein